jgi:hypothetical protein
MINKQTHDKIKTLVDLGLIKDYNLFVNEALNEKLDNLQKKKRFKEPTVDEVGREMFLKLHSLFPNLTEPEMHRASIVCELEANKFVNFYGSKNWMVGKNKMSKWKLAAVNWIIRVIEDRKKVYTKNSSDEVTNTDLYKNL